MALAPEQQASELIRRARQILVTTQEYPSTDSLASLHALALILKKLNKSFDLVIPNFNPQQVPDFLPKGLTIKSKVGALRTLHIKVNVQEIPLSELMYDVRDGLLDITLLPREGDWTAQDVLFQSGNDRYDLIITLDTPDMMSLGELGREQSEFIYRTPVINIDCSSRNEYWGQVNLVQLNAVSVSEVLFHWLNEFDQALMDADIATCLLTGMIARTKSFRTNNVTPKTLTVSSSLIDLGAKREAIIHGLWRTRSISTLKLWGRALARLNQDKDSGLIWTSLSESDFVEAGTTFEAVDGIVDELLTYAPEAKVILFVAQYPNELQIQVHALPPHSASELSRVFNGHGTREQAVIKLPVTTNPIDTLNDFITRFQALLKQQQ